MAAAAGGAGGPVSESNSQLVAHLSALTPDVVDCLFGIEVAKPVDAPNFIFLVGAPGVGKSSGHAFAIKNGFLPSREEGGYATINLDTLLESLTPFRAGSAMGHIVTHMPHVRDHAKFSTLQSYGSRHENVGAFKWYNTAHPAMREADPELVDALNGVRERFVPLRNIELPKGSSLMDINEAAIERAVERSVSIIYETTLSLNKKEGRVIKLDKIMALLEAKGPQYRVVLIHMTAPPEEIAVRIHHRQEFGMPYEKHPFYRYVPADPKAIVAMARGTAEAVSAIEEQYGGRIDVIPLETAMNAARLAAPRNFDHVAQMRRVRDVYRLASAAAAAAGGAGAKKSSSGSHKKSRSKTSSSERRHRNAAATRKSRSK